MGRFDRQVASAARMIRENGQKVVWQACAGGTAADPDKPWDTSGGSKTEHTVDMVFVSINRTDARFMQYFKGSELAEGFLKGLMPAVAFKPDINDYVVRGDETYKVKNVDPVAPNGQVILYKIEFERAA